MREFENYLITLDRSDTTIKGYLADLKHFAAWYKQSTGSELDPALITPVDVREYKQHMQVVERKSGATINHRLAALSCFLSWAVASGRIEQNPASKLKGVRLVSGGPKYLNRRDQYALQRAVERDVQMALQHYPKRWRVRQRDASLVMFLLHTGLRVHETLDLHLEDVEMGDRQGKVMVQRGKGGHQREVPLNKEARRALNDWFKARPESESRFLWVALGNAEAQSLTVRSVERVIARYGRDAHLPELTPHVLRHTFAKNLVDKGVGLEKVAALLGHASLNTTRIYIVPNQKDLENAVDLLSE